MLILNFFVRKFSVIKYSKLHSVQQNRNSERNEIFDKI